jgi:hypothetical protein
MSMSPRDWHDLASVYREGAIKSRTWKWNPDAEREAKVLDTMGDRCDAIAGERNRLTRTEEST